MPFATKLLALLGLVTTVAACETIGGAGQDLESAGQAIQSESNDVQY